MYVTPVTWLSSCVSSHHPLSVYIHLCVHFLPFYIDLGRYSEITLLCFCQEPMSKYSHILPYWGLRLQHYFLEGHKSIHSNVVILKEVVSKQNGEEVKRQWRLGEILPISFYRDNKGKSPYDKVHWWSGFPLQEYLLNSWKMAQSSGWVIQW